jgi:hypothetical protein
MKMPLAATIAATVAAAGLPASASADPPITPPEGTTCTFDSGITTCVRGFGIGTALVEEIDDPSCPSGRAQRVTETFRTTTTTFVFRGTHQQGDPRTETHTSTSVTVTCLPPPG